MQKCAVYAYDAFQFEDDGFVKEAIGLGSWSCQELDFAKRFYSSGSYVRLQNEIFRQFRKRRGFGGDFYVFTRPHKVENFKGQYMIFTYENRHQASFKGCFSAFSNFVRAPICRFLVLGGCEPLAYAKVCLGLLVWGAYGHPRLFSAIRDTDSHRDYSTNKMDFTSMPAHGSLAGYRNLFLHWPANLYFCLVRWVALKVEKGLIFSEAAHA